MAISGCTLQTRLDLYNSELALASSPVLFWNLCVQLEIWISIVICGLAAVVGQARKAPPPPHIQLLLSLLTGQLPAAQELYLHFLSICTSLTPSPTPSIPHWTMVKSWKEYVLSKYYHEKHSLILSVRQQIILWWDVRRVYELLHFIFIKLTILYHNKRVFFHQSLV